jgi:hypothetical protein
LSFHLVGVRSDRILSPHPLGVTQPKSNIPGDTIADGDGRVGLIIDPCKIKWNKNLGKRKTVEMSGWIRGKSPYI